MTGLLHRVAARATGNAAAVRSDARLTAAALRPVVAGIDSLMMSSERDHDLAPPPLHMARTRLAPQPDLDPFTGDAAPGRSHEERQRPARHDVIAPAAELEPGQRRPAPIVPARADEPVHEIHVHTTHVQRTIETAERDVRVRVQSADRAAVPTLDSRDPPLMLPARDAVPPSAPMTVAAVAARQVSAAASAARDVHIHIGSVEVTAVHDAVPARRRPPAAPPPMSLDAYFARRGRT